MRVHLVRHAKAGQRDRWEGDDRLRPLTKNGWRQAEAIADHLAARGASVLLTSPYLRCRQTLEPLARLLDVVIVDDERLEEGQSFGPVIDLLATVADGAVLCSHGDLIPETIAALQRRGCEIQGSADWRKGTVWTIDRHDGELSAARVWRPAD